MRKYVTVLIGYEENESIPAFAPGMKALDGEVYAVIYENAFDRLADLNELEYVDRFNEPYFEVH